MGYWSGWSPPPGIQINIGCCHCSWLLATTRYKTLLLKILLTLVLGCREIDLELTTVPCWLVSQFWKVLCRLLGWGGVREGHQCSYSVLGPECYNTDLSGNTCLGTRQWCDIGKTVYWITNDPLIVFKAHSTRGKSYLVLEHCQNPRLEMSLAHGENLLVLFF